MNRKILSLAVLAFGLLAGAALPAAEGGVPADAVAERQARQDRARARRMIAQALSLLEGGDDERALGILEAVTKMYVTSDERFVAWLEAGRAFLRKGRADEALVRLRKAGESSAEPVRAEALLLQARAHLVLGHDGEASLLLRRLTVDFPDSAFTNEAWYEIGQIHFKARRWARAREAFARVGTAVPRTSGNERANLVYAEAGQRLFVCVEDRDLAVAVANGEKPTVRAEAQSGDAETLELVPYGTAGHAALASVQTSTASGASEDGVLGVRGGETVTVTYVDRTDAKGHADTRRLARLKIVSTAVLTVMDGAYRQSVKGVFAGSPAFVQLSDLDLDSSDRPDTVTVAVTSLHRKPKSDEQALSDADASGDDEMIELASGTLALVETGARTGVFRGRISPVFRPGDPSGAPDGTILAEPDGMLRFSYVDNRSLSGDAPRTVTAEVAVLSGGSTEPQSIVSSAADPVLQSRKLLLEARLLRQWASIFRDVGLEAQANDRAASGLARVREVFSLSARQAVPRDILEDAYAVKWDLQLVMNDLDGAIRTCRDLLRTYPDTVLADVAFLRIAKARAESRDVKQLDEAARIYRSVLSMQNSGSRAEAQYQLAVVLEKTAKLRTPPGRQPDFTAAIAAYRACAEKFPQSSYAGESFKRVVTYLVERKDYDRAISLLERVFDDYPDAPWLDEMLLRWGVVCYRKGDREGAMAKFRRVLEEYPSGSAAAQADGFLQRLTQ